MNPFAFLNPARWLLYAGLLAAVVLGYFAWQEHQRDIGRAEVRAEWTADRERQTAAALAQAQANARETFRRLERQQEAQDAHDAQLARAQADARRASAAADGLRQQLAAFTDAQRGASGDPAAARNGPPAGDPIGLLADLLGRVEEAGRAMAAEADRRGIAGQQCQRAYESLTRRD